MLLTLLYMVATWVQSWRLSSLKARLQSILLGPEVTKPSVMLYTGTQSQAKDETNGNKSKLQSDTSGSNGVLSSSFCSNSKLAKLGDLLWYQGDKRLCTIYPQQQIDVSSWLLYPYGKSIFPLFTHNNAHTILQQNEKIHVLVEADLNYVPHASSKATKLEDYGLIVTWTSDEIFGVILETDLDHITKFSTTLMQGQCFINNGLPVTRIESVSVFGKPCVCNFERFNIVESKKLISSLQWNTYVKKLKLVSSTSRVVSQQNVPIEIKEIPGLVISPGSKPITLETPTILTIPSDDPDNHPSTSFPSTPPPTPASTSTVFNGTSSRLSEALTNSIDFNPSLINLSIGSLSNISSSRSQEFILEESSQENLNEYTPVKNTRNLKKIKDGNTKLSSMASSRSSLSTITVNYSPSKKTDIDPSKTIKPPNIFICAESAVANDNVREVLDAILKENKYAVCSLSAQEAKNDRWMDQANLLIVCGNVGSEVASQVVEYIVQGGKLLALCSDILKILLPAFKTAEVRENELVRFSYGKWKHVRMMHHVFCYQASPIKTKFSQDSEESNRSATPPTPVFANITDRRNKAHTFDVKILGSEETWHTPSILLANLTETGGRAVFSQIHLEADPSQYEFEESKYTALKQSNHTRLEIFSDLLGTHLNVQVNSKPKTPPTYCPGFFLGRHELKSELLESLKEKMQPNNILKTPKLEIQFCTSTDVKSATSSFLPVMVHRCPENFSTVEYFENLTTKEIGRLVIYADVMTSSNDIVNGLVLRHGLAVVPYRQTKGQGRGKNIWLSPEGCAMFTLQLHIPLKSVLGERISLIQHLTTVAIVHAIRSIPNYEDIDLRIKWPNDVYVGNGSKIGGLIVSTVLNTTTAICNIGVGVNLSNSSPTTCINELIKKHNEVSATKIKRLKFERYLALVFNEMEYLLDIVQSGNLDHFYELYYKYWMHTESQITVVSPDGTSQEVSILGIDSYGFLEVQAKRGNVFTVHPDGNSFDILSGLIAPKC